MLLHGIGRPAHPAQFPSRSRRKVTVVLSASSSFADTSSQVLLQQNQSLHTLLVNYERKAQLPGGTLVIRPMKAHELQKCTDLLTAAFVDTNAAKMEEYRRYLRNQICEYLKRNSAMIPRTLVLAAVWTPAPASDAQKPAAGLSEAWASCSQALAAIPDSSGATTNDLEPHSDSCSPSTQVIGTAEISLDASTRSTFWTLNPPKSAGYLCNMTVSSEYRRQGVARLLIDTVEEVCRLSGQPDIFLHARLQDQPAVRLYDKAGFKAVKEDMWLLQLLGLDRRYLMHKPLNVKD